MKGRINRFFIVLSSLFVLPSCAPVNETNNAAKTHEHLYVSSIINATCTNEGYTLHSCECGDTYKDNFINKINHDFLNKNDVNYHWQECKNCGEIINKSKHSFANDVTLPTCTETGYTTHTCDCGYFYIDSYVDQKGHAYDLKFDTDFHWKECKNCGEKIEVNSHNFHDEIIKPTCFEEGYTIHTCDCGYIFKDSYVDRLTHDYQSTYNGEKHYDECTLCHDKINVSDHHFSNTIVKPTCTEKGYTKHECECGYSFKDGFIDETGHNYLPTYNETHHFDYCDLCNSIINKEVHNFTNSIVNPTCTKEGYTIHECECGYSFKDNFVNALEHNYEVAYDSENHFEKCSRCGDIINSCFHDFDVQVIEPNCTEIGYTKHVCECGYSYKDNFVNEIGHKYEEKYDDQYHWKACDACTDIIEKESHSFVDSIVKPTCTEQGYIIHECDCGFSYKDTYVVATGHRYEKQFDSEKHWEKCTVCGDIINEEAHSIIDIVSNPTCISEGFTTHYCECGYSFITDQTNKLPHNHEKISGKEATPTENGLTDGDKCPDCGEILVPQKPTYYFDVVTQGKKAGEFMLLSHSFSAGDTIELVAPNASYFYAYKLNGVVLSKNPKYSYTMPNHNVTLTVVYSDYENCDIWDGSIATKFSGGTGTSSDPYLISTGAELALLAKNTNSLAKDDTSYYKLTKNIDLKYINWTPISDGSSSNQKTVDYDTSLKCFSGNFDGDNFKIYNLALTNKNCNANSKYLGLFGKIKGDNCVIKNIDICYPKIDINISEFEFNIGSLVGYASNINCIKNCNIVGGDICITGGDNYKPKIGGALGYINKCSTILNCSSDCFMDIDFVDSYHPYIGGFVGKIDYSDIEEVTSKGEIEFSEINNGSSVAYKEISLGGTIGYISGNGVNNSKSNLRNEVKLTVSASAELNLGGVVGYISSSNDDFLNCENIGDLIVEESKDSIHCGGIAGYGSGNCNSCYCEANIVLSKCNKSVYAGGLFGEKSASIKNSYFSGNINVTQLKDSYSYDHYVGGIAGKCGLVEACYVRGNLNYTNLELSASGTKIYSVAGICGSNNSANNISKCFSNIQISLKVKDFDSSKINPVSSYVGYLTGLYQSSLVDKNNGYMSCSLTINGYNYIPLDIEYTSASRPSDINFDETYWIWSGIDLFPRLKR